MEINLNILEISQKVFGIDGYLLLPFQDNKSKNEYKMPEDSEDSKVVLEYPAELKTINEEDIAEYSALGTPIYDVVEFKLNGETVLRLIDVPLITVTRAKNVVKTQMEGKDGTVKEIISNDDYKINIRGILSNDTENKKPWDKIEEMNTTFNRNVTYQVTSKLFGKLGITDVVFENIDFTAIEGFVNLQPYSLNLMSDDPIELKLK